MITLVLPSPIAQRLRELSRLHVETGAVLLARLAPTSSGSMRLLARQLIEVPDAAYERRESDRLLITSDGFVPALSIAEENECVPIWLHTHPGLGSSPMPSVHDGEVDEQLSDVFRLRANCEFYGAVVISHDKDGLTFTGHLDDGEISTEVDRLWVVGDRFEMHFSSGSERPRLDSAYSRNVRALGGAVQRSLGQMHVGVVGCGGTGSAVAEQLVRLGVRGLTLIDPDILSASNVTRVYGSTPADVGRPKVEIARDHLLRIAPDMTIEISQTMLTVEATARQLADCDVVFGCTDDNAGRLVLSRLATFLLIPVIDCGVIISSSPDGGIEGIDGRVTILTPGAACLVCRSRIDVQRAASELLTPEERSRRVDEGYAPALEGIEPAVVTFTSAVASAAVSELLERMTGYGPRSVPSEIILRLHERELSTNVALPRERHYCHPNSGKIGAGITTPFLEQTWQS